MTRLRLALALLGALAACETAPPPPAETASDPSAPYGEVTLFRFGDGTSEHRNVGYGLDQAPTEAYSTTEASLVVDTVDTAGVPHAHLSLTVSYGDSLSTAFHYGTVSLAARLPDSLVSMAERRLLRGTFAVSAPPEAPSASASVQRSLYREGFTESVEFRLPTPGAGELVIDTLRDGLAIGRFEIDAPGRRDEVLRYRAYGSFRAPLVWTYAELLPPDSLAPPPDASAPRP